MFKLKKLNTYKSEEQHFIERKLSLQEIKNINFYTFTKNKVRAKSLAEVDENEYVEILGIHGKMCLIKNRGHIPINYLDINIHCYNIYKELLPLLYNDIDSLKFIADRYPKELLNLARTTKNIESILEILFKDELLSNYKRKLDTESLRRDTPVIKFCKEILKISKIHITKDLNSSIFSVKINILINSLYKSISIKNCRISAMELTCSFFCLRILCPVLIHDVEFVKNVMKDVKIVQPIVEKFIKSPEKLNSPKECFLKDGEKIYQYLIEKDISYILDLTRIDTIRNGLFYI